VVHGGDRPHHGGRLVRQRKGFRAALQVAREQRGSGQDAGQAKHHRGRVDSDLGMLAVPGRDAHAADDEISDRVGVVVDLLRL
jgi:hypothetical protein